MVRAMILLRPLHASPARVRWEFDVVKKAEGMRGRIPPKGFRELPRVRCHQGPRVPAERARRVRRHQEVQHPRGCTRRQLPRQRRGDLPHRLEVRGLRRPRLRHRKPRRQGRSHGRGRGERVLFTYFRRKPTPVRRRHFYAYIAIGGWFYLHWTMLKESKGQTVGQNKEVFL